jgi:hypothetical protein
VSGTSALSIGLAKDFYKACSRRRKAMSGHPRRLFIQIVVYLSLLATAWCFTESKKGASPTILPDSFMLHKLRG